MEEQFDNSFKNFFNTMWRKNIFIQIFLVAFGITVYELITISSVISNFKKDTGFDFVIDIIGYGLAPIVGIIVAYKTMQFWNDLKNNKNR